MAQRAYSHRILPAKADHMILPLALVERWPSEYDADNERPINAQIKEKFETMEEALAHTTRQATLLYYEICLLERFRRDPEHFPVENKKSSAYVHNKKLDPLLRSKREQLSILLKYSDFPAMVVAAYKNAKLMDKSKYWENRDSIAEPVLVRGIANGKICDYVQSQAQDYYFIESGYLGNYPSRNNDGGRKIYHRIEKNAMQQQRMLDVPDDRWKKLCKFNKDLIYRGWKKSGSKILVVVPSDKPCKYYGIERNSWLETVVAEIKKYTDRDIVVREKQPRWDRSQNTIYQAIDDDVWALVTYNSIAAVEAVHYGIPAFALAPTAADPVCSKNLQEIETPFMPNENFVYKWLSSIAYGQFSMDEMISGEAWQIVLSNDDRASIKSVDDMIIKSSEGLTLQPLIETQDDN